MAEYQTIVGFTNIYDSTALGTGNNMNSLSQIRRSADMVYQRGGTYEVGVGSNNFLFESMVLQVEMYANDVKVGVMTIVPYETGALGGGGLATDYTYYYKFNVRPYAYMSNYIQSQHYKYYWENDWTTTNQTINIDNPYPNTIKANYVLTPKYYVDGTEYSGATQDLTHYTSIPFDLLQQTFTPSGYTNTGNVFNLVGGAFQFDNNYILPNFDQEMGTVIPLTGFTQTQLDFGKRLSPMSQFLMDYPSLPQMSETARFLTDAPRIQYIQPNENYVLYFLNGTTGDNQVIEADYIKFDFFNESNTRTYSFEKGITSPVDYLKVWSVPCGPVDIDNIYNETGLTWNNVAYYTATLCYGNTTSVGPTSETFYFYLYDNCKPENTRLVFLNQRGGFDYFTFTAYRQDTNKTTAQSYDSRYYSPNLASADRDFGRTVKTFATDVDQEIVLESDYINIETSNWLEQLFYSPQIYIMQPDYVSPIDVSNKIYKDLTPVQLLSTTVEKFRRKHQKLNKYKITLKKGGTFFVNKGF
jgi:hypothetical protein